MGIKDAVAQEGSEGMPPPPAASAGAAEGATEREDSPEPLSSLVIFEDELPLAEFFVVPARTLLEIEASRVVPMARREASVVVRPLDRPAAPLIHEPAAASFAAASTAEVLGHTESIDVLVQAQKPAREESHAVPPPDAGAERGWDHWQPLNTWQSALVTEYTPSPVSHYSMPPPFYSPPPPYYPGDEWYDFAPQPYPPPTRWDGAPVEHGGLGEWLPGPQPQLSASTAHADVPPPPRQQRRMVVRSPTRHHEAPSAPRWSPTGIARPRELRVPGLARRLRRLRATLHGEDSGGAVSAPPPVVDESGRGGASSGHARNGRDGTELAEKGEARWVGHSSAAAWSPPSPAAERYAVGDGGAQVFDLRADRGSKGGSFTVLEKLPAADRQIRSFTGSSPLSPQQLRAPWGEPPGYAATTASRAALRESLSPTPLQRAWGGSPSPPAAAAGEIAAGSSLAQGPRPAPSSLVQRHMRSLPSLSAGHAADFPDESVPSKSSSPALSPPPLRVSQSTRMLHRRVEPLSPLFVALASEGDGRMQRSPPHASPGPLSPLRSASVPVRRRAPGHSRLVGDPASAAALPLREAEPQKQMLSLPALQGRSSSVRRLNPLPQLLPLSPSRAGTTAPSSAAASSPQLQRRSWQSTDDEGVTNDSHSKPLLQSALPRQGAEGAAAPSRAGRRVLSVLGATSAASWPTPPLLAMLPGAAITPLRAAFTSGGGRGPPQPPPPAAFGVIEGGRAERSRLGTLQEEEGGAGAEVSLDAGLGEDRGGSVLRGRLRTGGGSVWSDNGDAEDGGAATSVFSTAATRQQQPTVEPAASFSAASVPSTVSSRSGGGGPARGSGGKVLDASSLRARILQHATSSLRATDSAAVTTQTQHQQCSLTKPPLDSSADPGLTDDIDELVAVLSGYQR